MATARLAGRGQQAVVVLKQALHEIVHSVLRQQSLPYQTPPLQ